MTGQLRWSNVNASEKRGVVARSNADVVAALRANAREIDNANDRAWLQSIASEPLCSEKVRAKLVRTIAYLEKHPRLRLLPDDRGYYARVQKAIRIHRETGKPPPKRIGRPRVRRAAPVSRQPPPPAWMTDPSLLPKKPPGRT